MFADRGYEAVTLRAIAKEIGYTHAVIYQYFPDKWHILAELSSETIRLLIQNFDAIAAEHLAPKERLFATSRGLIQFCTAHPQQFRNVFFGPENRDGIRAGQYINDIGTPLFQRFVQLFFDVAKDEGLPSRDDIVVAHTWWYTIFGLATLMVIQGVVPDLPDQTLVVEQTIATLWAGVQVGCSAIAEERSLQAIQPVHCSKALTASDYLGVVGGMPVSGLPTTRSESAERE